MKFFDDLLVSNILTKLFFKRKKYLGMIGSSKPASVIAGVLLLVLNCLFTVLIPVSYICLALVSGLIKMGTGKRR